MRSEKQLKGTQFAPKNQSGLTEIIQKASKKFEIINAAEGVIPNFVTEIQEGSPASLFRKKSGNIAAKTRNFKHSVYLSNGERLSGVSDNPAQDPFIGYDKNNQSFSVQRKYIKPDDILSSKDGNKTAEKIRKELIEKKVFSTGYIPNFAVTLSDDKYYNQKNIQHSITKLYKKSGGRQKLTPKELEFAAERYISVVQDSGKTYPGGNFNAGGKKFNFNEVSMALMKHGQFYQPKEGETENLSESFNRGYIPNFANPLADAVKREKDAGIPSSRIRIEKSSQLKSPQNPMGLAVTNTRDEPAGLQQGIRRAKSMGIDPKTHGASDGFIPNFQSTIDHYGQQYEGYKLNKPQEAKMAAANQAAQIKNTQDASNTLKNLASTAKESKDSIDSERKTRENSTSMNMDGLQKLFYFQSTLSMANGFLQQFAETGTGATKKLAELGTGISSVVSTFITAKEVANQLTDNLGNSVEFFKTRKDKDGNKVKVGLSEQIKEARAAIGKDFRTAGKGGGMGGLVKGALAAGKGLLRFAPLVGQAVTLFTGVNEVLKAFTGKGVMDYFANASDRAAKNLEKLSKSTQALESALGALQSQTENKEKIDELELLGSMRTQKQETELFQLKMKELDIQAKVQKSMSQLFEENVTGTAIASRLSHQFTQSGITVEEQTETLQKLIKVQKQRVAIEEGTKAFGDLIEKRFDKFASSFDFSTITGQDAEFLKQASSFRGAQAGMALGGVMAGSEDLDPKERLRILEENIGVIGKLDLNKISKSSADGITDFLSKKLKGTEDFGGSLIAAHIGDILDTIDDAEDNMVGFEKIEAEAAKNALDALVNQLHKQKDLLEKDGIAQTLAQSTAQVKEEYLKIIRSIKDERKQRLHRQDLENSISATQRKIAESQISLLDEHQAISKSTLIRKESSRKIEEISEKFSTDILKANNTSLGAMQSVSEEFIKTDQLAKQFRKGAGITMADAVENLKKSVGQNLTSLDLSGIETAIGEALSPADAQELRNSFASVSSRIADLDDNGKIINEFMREYGSITEGTVAAAFMAALNQKEIMKLTQKQKNLLTDSINDLTRARETAETQRKNALSILKEEETLTLIRAKTVEGAVKLKKD